MPGVIENRDGVPWRFIQGDRELILEMGADAQAAADEFFQDEPPIDEESA